MTRRGSWWAARCACCGLALAGASLAGSCQPNQAKRLADDTKPLVIRRGGTYTGTFRSTESTVPCISIETEEPVTLRGCVLEGAGNLIEAFAGGAQLTVVDCRGIGLLPSRDQARRGRFIEANSARSLTIEHNHLEQTTGISVYEWSGDGSPGQTLTVRYNQSRNIDGRLRDGSTQFANFLGLNGVFGLENVEIAWNEVINEPDKSLVEDNISIFNSSGSRRSPMLLHNNYIQGAYPIPATSTTYSGSGITLDSDDKPHSALTTTAFVKGYQNQVVSTCAALNIAAGHDNEFFDNRIVTSGWLPNGTKLAANYAAIGLWNAYKQPESVFFGNSFRNNTIGFVHWGGAVPFTDRQDHSPGSCTPCTGTTSLPNPVTRSTEENEWKLWQQKLRKAGIKPGPSASRPARETNLFTAP